MGRAVLVKGTGLLIDEDALLGGQDAGAQSEAIEGRLANLAEIVGGLAEVLVVLLVKELVVARDGGEEVFLALSGKAQLVSQLFERVGLEGVALGNLFLKDVKLALVIGAGLGGAADVVEVCPPLHIFYYKICASILRDDSETPDNPENPAFRQLKALGLSHAGPCFRVSLMPGDWERRLDYLYGYYAIPLAEETPTP